MNEEIISLLNKLLEEIGTIPGEYVNHFGSSYIFHYELINREKAMEILREYLGYYIMKDMPK